MVLLVKVYKVSSTLLKQSRVPLHTPSHKHPTHCQHAIVFIMFPNLLQMLNPSPPHHFRLSLPPTPNKVFYCTTCKSGSDAKAQQEIKNK